MLEKKRHIPLKSKTEAQPVETPVDPKPNKKAPRQFLFGPTYKQSSVGKKSIRKAKITGRAELKAGNPEQPREVKTDIVEAPKQDKSIKYPCSECNTLYKTIEEAFSCEEVDLAKASAEPDDTEDTSNDD